MPNKKTEDIKFSYDSDFIKDVLQLQNKKVHREERKTVKNNKTIKLHFGGLHRITVSKNNIEQCSLNCKYMNIGDINTKCKLFIDGELDSEMKGNDYVVYRKAACKYYDNLYNEN